MKTDLQKTDQTTQKKQCEREQENEWVLIEVELVKLHVIFNSKLSEEKRSYLLEIIARDLMNEEFTSKDLILAIQEIMTNESFSVPPYGAYRRIAHESYMERFMVEREEKRQQIRKVARVAASASDPLRWRTEENMRKQELAERPAKKKRWAAIGEAVWGKKLKENQEDQSIGNIIKNESVNNAI